MAVKGGTSKRSRAKWALGSFASFVLGVALWDFVAQMLARNSLLGAVALALTAGAVLALLGLALREVAGFARLARIDGLRRGAAAVGHDLRAARAVVAGLRRLTAARPDLAAGRARLDARAPEVLDADALLALAETELLAPLDDLARREVEAAARQVAMVTALVPLALADVATALWANLRMIRRIAELYGGRSGGLSSLRLLREVFAHLAATGALAVGDDLIQSVAGGGLVSKLSRRFGEGMVNAALTARVGVAVIEVCRPLPFAARPRPRVTALVTRAVAGLFGDQP
ncbi:MAG: TIGR01620 family protein [Rhodobacterales bacterium]|nr:TIGR01620 family protein [Rhodobacterales bacterium]